VLDELILKKVLRADREGISFTRDIEHLTRSVRAGRASMAFILPETDTEQIMKIVSKKEILPQKSTYFYPKLPSGLVMNYMGDAG